MTYWFEKVTAFYQPQLYRVALNRLNSVPDAQDAVQDTLLKAWLNRETLYGCDYLGAWLMRVLLNECHSTLRRRQCREKYLAAIAQQDPFTSPQEDKAVWRLDMGAALSQLDEKQRQALELMWFGGFSMAAIAQLTRQTRLAVSSRINRGRARVRRIMAGQE